MTASEAIVYAKALLGDMGEDSPTSGMHQCVHKLDETVRAVSRLIGYVNASKATGRLVLTGGLISPEDEKTILELLGEFRKGK